MMMFGNRLSVRAILDRALACLRNRGSDQGEITAPPIGGGAAADDGVLEGAQIYASCESDGADGRTIIAEPVRRSRGFAGRRWPMSPDAIAAASLPKIYLADNSRLRIDAVRQREVAEEICDRHGLVAEWPSEHFLFPSGTTVAMRVRVGLPIDDPAVGRMAHKWWYKILGCRAVVAEITPFRGSPHLNPVIAFEIGAAVAHEIPVFAWTRRMLPAAPRGEFARPKVKIPTLIERIWCGDRIAWDGNWRDEQGNLVENLNMVECATFAANFVSASTSLADAIAAAAKHLSKEQ